MKRLILAAGIFALLLGSVGCTATVFNGNSSNGDKVWITYFYTGFLSNDGGVLVCDTNGENCKTAL